MRFYHIDQPITALNGAHGFREKPYQVTAYDRSKGDASRNFSTYIEARDYCELFHNSLIIGGFSFIMVDATISARNAEALLLNADEGGVVTFFETQEDGLLIKKNPPGDFINDFIGNMDESSRVGLLPPSGSMFWSKRPMASDLNPLTKGRTFPVSRMKDHLKEAYFSKLR